MTDDHDRGRVGPIVGRLQRPAKLRVSADEVKVVAAHDLADQDFGRAGA